MKQKGQISKSEVWGMRMRTLKKLRSRSTVMSFSSLTLWSRFIKYLYSSVIAVNLDKKNLKVLSLSWSTRKWLRSGKLKTIKKLELKLFKKSVIRVSKDMPLVLVIWWYVRVKCDVSATFGLFFLTCEAWSPSLSSLNRRNSKNSNQG